MLYPRLARGQVREFGSISCRVGGLTTSVAVSKTVEIPTSQPVCKGDEYHSRKNRKAETNLRHKVSTIGH